MGLSGVNGRTTIFWPFLLFISNKTHKHIIYIYNSRDNVKCGSFVWFFGEKQALMRFWVCAPLYPTVFGHCLLDIHKMLCILIISCLYKNIPPQWSKTSLTGEFIIILSHANDFLEKNLSINCQLSCGAPIYPHSSPAQNFIVFLLKRSKYFVI